MTKNDYSRPPRAPFPRALAAGIARKASIMASRLEEQATRTMVHDAQRALDRGITAEVIAQEMGLPTEPDPQGEARKSGHLST